MNRFKGGRAIGSILVLIFVLIFLWGRNAEAGEIGLGVGFGAFNSTGATVQEISYHTDDYRWFASYARVGGHDSNRIALQQSSGAGIATSSRS